MESDEFIWQCLFLRTNRNYLKYLFFIWRNYSPRVTRASHVYWTSNRRLFKDTQFIHLWATIDMQFFYVNNTFLPVWYIGKFCVTKNEGQFFIINNFYMQFFGSQLYILAWVGGSLIVWQKLIYSVALHNFTTKNWRLLNEALLHGVLKTDIWDIYIYLPV